MSKHKHPVTAASITFWFSHLLLLGVFFIPFNAQAAALVFGLYFLRMFFITAGYHRYFSHRSYSTSRAFQFFLAFMAQTSSQKGALWWAAHHRHHHRHSDGEKDLHSPHDGFYWSHCGWFLSDAHEATDLNAIRDLARYPELVWLDRYWAAPVFVLGFVLLAFGGWSAVFWGLGVSTVLLWHGTFTINSLSHLWGTRRYSTNDLSRNNGWLALITLGEGWHNNHHRFPSAARNGIFWWELDFTYYVLKLLAAFGLISNLRGLPQDFSRAAEAPTAS